MMVGHWSGGLEGGQKLHIISRGCAGVQQGLAQLQGRGGFQVCSNKNELWSVLYYTTYGRGKMSDWIQPCTVWLRPTWNWWYFRRTRSPTASTRGGRPDKTLLQLMHQEDTRVNYFIIPQMYHIKGGSEPELWPKRCQMPASVRGVAVVHCGLLPGAGRHFNHIESHCVHIPDPHGIQNTGGWQPQHKPKFPQGEWPGWIYHYRYGDGSTQVHVSELPAAPYQYLG